MSLTSMAELLEAARCGGYAVGYFEAWDSYSLDAVLQAAEEENAPVILGFGCLLVDQTWLDHGGIEILGSIGRSAAARSTMPVALLLNECHTLPQALRGIEAGFNAVMLHTDDVAMVAELVEVAHRRGVSVEGEIGTLPNGGADGRVDASRASTTEPEAATAYLAAAGVDCLAVSFGNVHTLESAFAQVDLDRLAAIRACVDVPLVVHGGTGFPGEAVPEAIERGVAKFNVGTALKRAYLQGLREALAGGSPKASPHDLVGSHKIADLQAAAMKDVVAVVRELIRSYGGSGRA
jgi:ketose-bisphosphate aldolase